MAPLTPFVYPTFYTHVLLQFFLFFFPFLVFFSPLFFSPTFPLVPPFPSLLFPVCSLSSPSYSLSIHCSCNHFLLIISSSALFYSFLLILFSHFHVHLFVFTSPFVSLFTHLFFFLLHLFSFLSSSLFPLSSSF